MHHTIIHLVVLDNITFWIKFIDPFVSLDSDVSSDTFSASGAKYDPRLMLGTVFQYLYCSIYV